MKFYLDLNAPRTNFLLGVLMGGGDVIAADNLLCKGENNGPE